MDEIDERIKAKEREVIDINSLLAKPKGFNDWGLPVVLLFVLLLFMVSSKIYFKDQKEYNCSLYSEMTYKATQSYFCSIDIDKKELTHFKESNEIHIYINDSCFYTGKFENMDTIIKNEESVRILLNISNLSLEENVNLPIIGKICISLEKVSLLNIITGNIYKSFF